MFVCMLFCMYVCILIYLFPYKATPILSTKPTFRAKNASSCSWREVMTLFQLDKPLELLDIGLDFAYVCDHENETSVKTIFHRQIINIKWYCYVIPRKSCGWHNPLFSFLLFNTLWGCFFFFCFLVQLLKKINNQKQIISIIGIHWSLFSY